MEKDIKENIEGYSNKLLYVLNEYWESFLFLLPKAVIAIIAFIILMFLAVQVEKILGRKLNGKSQDPLLARFISRISKLIIVVLAFILALHILGFTGIAGGLLAGAGLSAFIVGFAFKDIAENFLAGVILAFNRPFTLNDAVQIEEYTGKIVALNLRTTHIKTFDGKDIYIPNSIVVKQPLTNLTRDGLLRMDFIVGIAYEDDIDQAIEVILRSINHPELHPTQTPFAIVDELAASTVNLKVFFWTETDDYKRGSLILKSEIIKCVKNALVENGFTLPANIQELKLYEKAKPISLKLQMKKGKKHHLNNHVFEQLKDREVN